MIITGEHFVVHGSLALAAAIRRRVRVEASKAEENTVISETLAEGSETVARRFLPVTKVVEKTLSYIGSKYKIRLKIDSDIPSASGLGSSSAVSVATAAAVSGLHDVELSREVLFDLAMVGERAVHGNPSGVDVAVAIYGGILLFEKGGRPRPVEHSPKIEMVVAISGMKRSTSQMISRFGDAQGRMPNFFRAMVGSSSDLTDDAAESLSRGDIETLGAIMNFYNLTLSYFGLGTRLTDKMIDACIKNGAVAAKITGAGGGGSILALAPAGTTKKIIEAMKSSGHEAFSIKFPEPGVRSWRKD